MNAPATPQHPQTQTDTDGPGSNGPGTTPPRTGVPDDDPLDPLFHVTRPEGYHGPSVDAFVNEVRIELTNPHKDQNRKAEFAERARGIKFPLSQPEGYATADVDVWILRVLAGLDPQTQTPDPAPQQEVERLNTKVRRLQATIEMLRVEDHREFTRDPGDSDGTAFIESVTSPPPRPAHAAGPPEPAGDPLPDQVTFAVMSSKGGSGKSTTALLLAGQIAKSSAKAGKPLKVCVVDMDTRDGQVASMLGRYVPTSLNIRVSPVWDEETVKKNLVHDDTLGIDALLAPIRSRTDDDVGPEFYRYILRVLKRTHDVVVLDTNTNYRDPLVSTVALPESSAILFVTTLATTSVQGMARALREIIEPVENGGMGIRRSKIGVVVNQSIGDVGMERSQVDKAALKVPVVGAIPLMTNEVFTATSFNRIPQLLNHPVLGPAFYRLARAVLPGRTLAPINGDTSTTEWARAMEDLGPVRFLLDNPEFIEVMVNSPERVFAKRLGGELLHVPMAALDPQALRSAAQHLIRATGGDPDTAQVHDARCPDGSRVNIINLDHATILTFRRFPAAPPWTLQELVDRGTLPADAASDLGQLVKSASTIAVAGRTGSGKTVFLEALARAIPATDRVITIEDAPELRLDPQAHVLALESRPADRYGKGEVSTRKLVRNAVRMSVTRIVVGEVRGPEALDMLQACVSGLSGSLFTLHASEAAGVVSRLTAILRGTGEIPAEKTMPLVTEALDVVVFLSRTDPSTGEPGKYRVERIGEVLPDGTLTGIWTTDPRTGELVRSGSFSRRLRRKVGLDKVSGPQVAEPPVRRGKIVTVTGASGGTGTTSLTVLLAAAARAEGTKVVIVDASVDDEQLGTYLGTDGPGLADAATRTAEGGWLPDEIARVVQGTPHGDVLLAPARPSGARAVTGEFFAGALGALRATYDLVLVSAAGGSREPDLWSFAAARVSDAVVCVTDQRLSSARAAASQAFLDPFRDSALGIIVNRWSESGRLDATGIADAAGGVLLGTVKDDPAVRDWNPRSGVPSEALLGQARTVLSRVTALTGDKSPALPDETGFVGPGLACGTGRAETAALVLRSKTDRAA